MSRLLARIAVAASASAALTGAACMSRPHPPDDWSGQLRPPAGADSGAVEVWVAAQQRRCRGRVVRVYSDFGIADTAPRRFHIQRFFEGIECHRP